MKTGRFKSKEAIKRYLNTTKTFFIEKDKLFHRYSYYIGYTGELIRDGDDAGKKSHRVLIDRDSFDTLFDLIRKKRAAKMVKQL